MTRPEKLRLFQPVVVIAVVALIFALPLRGQTGAATAPSAQGVSVAASNGQEPDSTQVATIHAYSNLVVLDVVVSDSHKEPVKGLKASDFTLLEGGKPQTIRNFEEHDATPGQTQLEEPKLPAGLYTNATVNPANGPVNVLLLDYLNTPLTSQAQSRRQLLDFLNKAPAGTRIAVFILTYKLDMLQGFTSDMSVLKAALGSKKATMQGSDVLSDALFGGTMGTTAFEDASGGLGATAEVDQVIMQSAMQADAQINAEQMNDRALYTLSAFDDLARYLVGIPGRKNVIWFSGSFPLDVEPDVNATDGAGINSSNTAVIRNDEQVRKTDNLLTRAQIAVYPVDARGLQTDIDSSAGVNAGESFIQLSQEQETMYEMADDTGGEAFVNTNGLSQAISKAIQHGSNYYTLTYVPTNVQWDERFRSIKIKVDDPSVKQLNYRNGYFAFNPNDPNKLNAQGSATALVTPSTMMTAMMHGGPDPTEIKFKVRIRPADTPPEPTVIRTNKMNPDPKVKVEGPYKEYGVDMVPDPKEVMCSEDSMGNRHCALEIWTYVYNMDGQLLVTTGNRVHRMLTPAQYQQMLSGGIAFHQEVSIPMKGLHFLRTGIHDMVSDRVGAVEIPVAQVARLEPLQPPRAIPVAAAQPAASVSGSSTATPTAAVNESTPADTTVDTIASPVEKPVVAPPPQPTLQRRTPTSGSAPATP